MSYDRAFRYPVGTGWWDVLAALLLWTVHGAGQPYTLAKQGGGRKGKGQGLSMPFSILGSPATCRFNHKKDHCHQWPLRENSTVVVLTTGSRYFFRLAKKSRIESPWVFHKEMLASVRSLDEIMLRFVSLGKPQAVAISAILVLSVSSL